MTPATPQPKSRDHLATWSELNQQIIACEQCVRLRVYCQQIAIEKRKAYREETYWGRPVPNLGDPHAQLLIVGLAPAAHGANRTGRMFTGDRSGEWLFRALHKAGFANQSQATHAADGLTLLNCAITAAAHCAPPDNRPTPQELQNCNGWLERTCDLLSPQVFVALGQIGWKSLLNECRRRDWLIGRPPKFAHGAVVELSQSRRIIGSYHPSQQNTFTGRLTEAMFDAIFSKARQMLSD